MKKTLFALFFFFLISLFPISSKTEETKIQKVANPYTSVCVRGEIRAVRDANKYEDYLPKGYVSNSPDEGILKIGNEGFDGDVLPPLILQVSLFSRLAFVIKFNRTFSTFPSNTLRDEIGFEMEYQERNQERKKTGHFQKASSVRDVFSPDVDYRYRWNGVNTGLNIVPYFFAKRQEFAFTFSSTYNMKIYSFTFYYGDHPVPLSEVHLTEGNYYPSLDDVIEETDISQQDCSSLYYQEEVHPSKTYTFYSAYGHTYSIDYLYSCFAVRDPENENIYVHPDRYIDPGSYFSQGATAPLGSQFILTLYSSLYPEAGRIRLEMVVADIKPPILTKKENAMEVSYHSAFTSASFLKDYFYFKDDHDGENLTFSLEQENGFPFNQYVIGEKEAILVAKDSHDNESRLPFSMKLFDDVPPYIEATQDEYHISMDNPLTKKGLLSLFQITDEIDGTLEGEITKNTYSGNESQVGNYEITLEATDKSGNTASKSILVFVVPKNAPTFYVKGSFLTFVKGHAPREEELLSLLIRNNLLPDKVYTSLKVISGDKIDDSLSLGLHEITLEAKANDDSAEQCDLTVNVVSEEKEANQGEEEGLSFLQRIFQFFRRLFEAIIRFFRHLFGLGD